MNIEIHHWGHKGLASADWIGYLEQKLRAIPGILEVGSLLTQRVLAEFE